MKNRLIITVSDVHGTRAFNVHQIIKKLIVFVVLFVVLIIGGGSWFISSLSERMNTLKSQKEKEIALREKELNVKEEQINTLIQKLGFIKGVIIFIITPNNNHAVLDLTNQCNYHLISLLCTV